MGIIYVNSDESSDGQGGWGSQGMSLTGGGGPARVPNLRVREHPRRGEKGELTSCTGTVQSAWLSTSSETQGGKTRLPAKVSGRHVVRG